MLRTYTSNVRCPGVTVITGTEVPRREISWYRAAGGQPLKNSCQSTYPSISTVSIIMISLTRPISLRSLATYSKYLLSMAPRLWPVT